ncbi:hypothetical protein Fcan01_26578, partial [Folsomia candida]
MPTRLGHKAVSLHFSGNSYLPQMPVDFDAKARQFSFTKITKANFSKYAAWLSVVFFFFYFISIGHSTYMIVRQVIKPNPEVQIKNMFLAVMMNTAGTMVVGTVIEILRSGKEAVERTNWLIRRYDMFQEEDMGRLSTQPIWRKTSGEIDTFGIAAYAMLSPLPFVPFFAAIFGLVANLDVYKYLWHTSDHTLLHIHYAYLDYTQMKITEAWFLGPEATIALELIECGIWLCAASIFATIRLYTVLPFGFYVMFPFFTFAIFGISQLLLPVIAGMHENSAKALTKWVSQVEGKVSRNRRYFGRKFRALRPIRFIAGFNGFTFFMLDKSFKTYFWR